MSTPSPRARVTYANVASTLALVLALGGTGAYAAGLAKDSVGSKQIKNNAVKGVDVNEGSLGVVPNAADAAKLGGLPVSSFDRSFRTARAFSEGSPITATLGSLGSIQLECDDQDTPAVSDDAMRFGYSITASNVVTQQRAAFSDFPFDPPEWIIYNSGSGGFGTSTSAAKHVHVEYYITTTSGSLTFLARLYGYTDSENLGCNGIIEVTRLH